MNAVKNIWNQGGCLGKGLLIGLLLLFLPLSCITTATVLRTVMPEATPTANASNSHDITGVVKGQEATAVIIPSSTATVKPSLTPKPTATIKPTSTTRPTATVDQSKAEIQDYKDALIEKFAPCQEALIDFQKKNQEASANPYLVTDHDWTASISSTLVQMKKYCGSVGDFTPVPPGYQKTNNYLQLFASEIELVVSTYTEGLDNIDAGKIQEAIYHMVQAADYMDKATKAMPQ